MMTKAQTEIELAQSIGRGIKEDLAELDRWWPASKRGSNGQRVLDSIKRRLAGLDACLEDALEAL